MRLFRTRLHAYVALVFLACVVTAVIVVLLLPPERVTRANFEKIEIGMSVAEVLGLLGPPKFQAVESGIVRGPLRHSVYFGPKRPGEEGYQDYTRQQWNSADLAMVVIFDASGRVVFRDSLEVPRDPSTFEIVWFWVVRHF